MSASACVRTEEARTRDAFLVERRLNLELGVVLEELVGQRAPEAARSLARVRLQRTREKRVLTTEVESARGERVGERRGSREGVGVACEWRQARYSYE